MFIETEEMKSVLYDYQMTQISEEDEDIIVDGIRAAISETRGYLIAANNRRETASLSKQQYRAWRLYDVDKIFARTGEERNAFLCRIVKRIAAYNICELSTPDVILDRVKERYDDTILTLRKIAGEGEYVNSRLIIDDADFKEEDETTTEELTLPIRMVSRPKFHHDF